MIFGIGRVERLAIQGNALGFIKTRRRVVTVLQARSAATYFLGDPTASQIYGSDAVVVRIGDVEVLALWVHGQFARKGKQRRRTLLALQFEEDAI